MVLQLLPASAKAFASRTTPTVVLSTRPETWLTQSLKRVNKLKRPLNSVSQHKRCLEDLLSGEEAHWSLASIMVPRKPKADLRENEDKIVEAFSNYQLLQIDGYVVHVDMVSQHEVAFKLTDHSIESLIDYHKQVYSPDAAAEYTYDWPEKERQLKKLHLDFIQAVNSYVFRTGSRALEGIDDEGSGELLEGRSADVKTAINNLFQPLLPPPPKIVDVIAPPMIASHWWSPQYYSFASYAQPTYYQQQQQQQQTQSQTQYQQQHQHYHSVETWPVLASTPSPTPTRSTLQSAPWSSQSGYVEPHVASPSPPFAQPYTSSQYVQAMVTSPTQPLPFPSQLVAQQCSTSVGAMYGNSWGFHDMPFQTLMT